MNHRCSLLRAMTPHRHSIKYLESRREKSVAIELDSFDAKGFK